MPQCLGPLGAAHSIHSYRVVVAFAVFRMPMANARNSASARFPLEADDHSQTPLPRIATSNLVAQISQHRPLDRMPLFDMFLEAHHGPSPDRAVGAFKCCHYLCPLHGAIGPAKSAHSRCFITTPQPEHRASDPTSVIRIGACPLRSAIARILQHPLVGVCRDARRVEHPAHGYDQAANARPNEAHDDGDD